MQNLSMTQKEILLNAANSADGIIEKWPSNLKGASVTKVIDSLLSKGFIREMASEVGDSEFKQYQITQEGKNVLNSETSSQEEKKVSRSKPSKAKSPRGKLAIILEMLQREQGATVQEIMDETGWKRHTARGAISGQINKKWGFSIKKIVNEQGQKAYKVAEPEKEITVPG